MHLCTVQFSRHTTAVTCFAPAACPVFPLVHSWFPLRGLRRSLSQICVTPNHVSVQRIAYEMAIFFVCLFFSLKAKERCCHRVSLLSARIHSVASPRAAVHDDHTLRRRQQQQQFAASLIAPSRLPPPCRSPGASRSGDRGGDQRRHGHPVVDARPGQPQSHHGL